MIKAEGIQKLKRHKGGMKKAQRRISCKKIFFIVFGITLLVSCTKERIIELPLTMRRGYGPFEPGFRGLPAYSKDQNREMTILEISGIPENWTDVKTGDIETNVYQAVYQNYLLGNISREKYETLQKSWSWIPDTLNLSKEPIKCKIAFAFGRDTAGVLKMIVDSNNNYDLSDDQIFNPIILNHKDWGKLDSIARENSIDVTYERFIKNKIVQENSPLFVVYDSGSGRFMYNFPQFAVTRFQRKEIAICSAN